MEKKASRKKTAHYFIAICSGLILGITTIFGFLNLDKSSDAVSGDIIEGITKLMLPDNPTVYEKKPKPLKNLN